MASKNKHEYPGQLNLHAEFDKTSTARNQEVLEIDHEDKEREEAMIQETLTRSEWEEKMRDEELEKQAEFIAEQEEEERKKEEAEWREADHPTNDLYRRFQQFKKK